MHSLRTSSPQIALKLLRMYVDHTSILLLYLLGPACSMPMILPEFYLLNTVCPSCNTILAEIHMQEVISTSHLEPLLKRSVKASILPEE